MKSMFFLFTSSIVRLSFTGLAVFVTLVSCSKSDNRYYQNISAPFAQVEIAHAVAGGPALDAAFDQNRLAVKTFNFTDRIDYLRVSPGQRNFKVLDGSTATANQLFAKNLNFQKGQFYSLFIVDTASKMDVVALKDSSRSAGSDSVRIRFANMSPDAPGLDLYVKGVATPIATNITYKNAGEFFSYKAALNVTFEVKRNWRVRIISDI
ncbi:DUF4397 domain-containing protein [Niabella sp. W65]|nr:DUF4397 domain-containing protein [Niabella sp. W65]MCH7364104.1 DUF4397 domain-containing protein [Niabella sp. W65]